MPDPDQVFNPASIFAIKNSTVTGGSTQRSLMPAVNALKA
jgi:hypothetical protein